MREGVQTALADMVDKMPAFPAGVQRILALTSDIDVAPKDMVEVIAHDPVMTMKILKLVNSAYYNLPRQIGSVGHAVAYVGINTIKNMAIGIATIGMLPRTNKAGLDMRGFLRHSLATAAIARRLGFMVSGDGADAADFFVAGLLHDIGKVVFAMYAPTGLARAMDMARREGLPLHVTEVRALGADHCHVGAMLAGKWRLREELVTSLREHHDAGKPGTAMRDCVFAANQISKVMVPSHAGDARMEPFPEPVVSRFGMDVGDLAREIDDMDAEIEAAMAYARQ